MSNAKNRKPHVPVKDFYSIEDVAALLCTSESRIREFASRKDDPMPFRRLKNRQRGMFVSRRALGEWVERNSVLVRYERERSLGKEIDA